jgi:O-antigen/teichoic acid export membrane protein
MDGPRLARQVAGSAVTNIWLTLLGLFTTPYLLLGLGNAGYGVFAMVSVVSVHLSNLELGFGQATVRYLARARAASDMERERVIVETSFAVFLAGGLTGAVLLFAGAPYLVSSVFHIDGALQQEALTAFRLGAFILACSFISSFFSSVLQVFGRFDWLNGSRAAFGTAAAVSAVGAVAAGGGIDAVFVLQAGVACLASLTLGVGVIRNWEGGMLPRIAPSALREMGAYAILAFIGGLAYQWMVNGAPLVLAAYVDAAEIPAFSVPHMVLQKLTVLIASASLAFLPFASAASMAADRSRLRAAFESNLRLTILAMGPVAGYLAVFAPTLLGAWVSPEFGLAAAPCLRLLAVAALLLALSGPPADVARGFGHPSWVLAYTSSVAVLEVSVSVVAIPSYGAVGAAFALSASVLVGTIPLLLMVAQRLLGLRAWDMARTLAGPSAAVGLVTALYAAGAVLGGGLIGALITGGLATAAYAATGFLWILKPREREALRQVAARA